MKKVLLITDVNFWERSSGNRTRIYSLVTYLSTHVQLTVVNTGPAPANIETILRGEICADFYVLEKTKYLNSNGYGRRLKALLKGKHFDTIIIEYIHSSYFLNFLIEGANVILDAHDIISDRAVEFKKFNYSGAIYELTKETEAEIFKVYDKVLVLCNADLEKLNTMIGPGKGLLCPHPVNTTTHVVRGEVKNIAFIASAYLPNKDAIEFFIEECWPQILAKYPVQLIIYGTVCYGLVLVNNAGITLKGFVPDENEIYEQADLIINPVRFGAGIKIKNMEALAHGIPLVTTTHGARGIEAGINSAFLVADGAIEIVNTITLLIENIATRQQLADNAREFVRCNFSPGKCYDPLLAVINE